MTRKIIRESCCVVFITLLSITASAQFYMYNDQYSDHEILTEIGIGTGGMSALTDLGGRPGKGGRFLKDFSAATLHPCFSVVAKAEFRNWLGISLTLSKGLVSAADSLQKTFAASTHGRYERNLSFRSHIYETALHIEIHPLLLFENFRAIRLSPYLHAGIGVFHFNPQTELNGQWYDLVGFATEGQGLPGFPHRQPYSLWQKNIPIGAGLRYEAGPKMMLILDFCHRILSTDYLDDVSGNYIDPATRDGIFSPEKSLLAAQLADRRNQGDGRRDIQRGNPDNKDSYFSFELRIVCVLNRRKR